MTNLEKYYKTHGVGDGWFIKLDPSIMDNKEFMKISSHEDFVKFMLSEAKYEPTVKDVEEVVKAHFNCTSEFGDCNSCPYYVLDDRIACEVMLNEKVDKILEWALEKMKEE